ncbi:MAG: AAA family ATPase [Candidatus Rokubacteria bacterium]|nr:AAA family ATPase [Candidatus Rokubacteria bacterium]
MRCPQCQEENPPQAKFCNACGTRFHVLCPACAHANAPGSRFCSECGRALGEGVVSTPPTKFASPQSYVPRHLVERILTSRSALEGERKQVTVLFADLKGSMELLADRDPEDARKLLDPVLERMMEAVHRYEGTVNQVMGDGIMALFGAPLAHEDHAVRACYAALSMQEQVKRYAEEAQRTAGVPIHVRVGLNSGEVVVRSIGSDLHMDYTAVGQTTHLAARMEQMAMPGSVLLTADVLRLVEGHVLVKPLGSVPIKGLEAPIDVYELTGAGPARSRLQAAAARGLTRFVGRQGELEALRGALERAGAGQGQVVALVGEPGIGKSRLFWEFTRSHRTQGWLILESSSVSYGKATAHLPVIDLLKTYLQVEDGETTQRVREKVTGKALTLDERLKEIIPPLLWLLEALPDDDPFRSLDPRQRPGRILDAVKALLLRESQRQPLVLVFEDLHWIDSETQTLLDSLVEGLPTARLLLLVNYRPEYRHGWGGKTYYTQLRIDPLPPESCEEVLQALIGDDPGVAPLKHLLTDRTEGNPFFLEESVRSLVEARVLIGERGAYRLATPLQAIQVPATVQAVLAARIDRLDPEEKTLLQTAAVIGKDVPLPLLQAVADQPEDALRRGLAHLQAAEFLYETSLFPIPEYTFKHALTLEVAYGSLLQERRRALHARIVEAIERLYADRLAEHTDRLAHHAFRGEVWDKAVAYLHQSGASASPPTMASSFWWIGEHDRAVEAGKFELHVAADFRDFGGKVVANFRVGQAYHALGDYGQAVDFLGRAVGELEGDLAREHFGLIAPVSVLSRTWLVLCLSERGEFAEGIARGEEAARFAEAIDHPYSLMLTHFGIGSLHLLKGDLAKTIPALERSLALGRAASIPLLFPFVASSLGSAYALAGRVAEAVPLLEQGVEQAASMKLMALHSQRVAWLGEAHLLAGRRDSALQLAGWALNLSRQLKERANQAWALRLLGEIHLHSDAPDLERAEASYGEALALADELGMRPLAARCHLGLGTLCRTLGSSEQARAELSAAVEIFRSMEMTFWQARAEAFLNESS